MRVCVTGASNPTGEAVVRGLAEAGHQIRAFGIDSSDDRFDGLDVQCFPGWIEVGGSLEPVLAERQVLIHTDNAAPVARGGKARRTHAARIAKGSLYARYAAEREQVDHFIHITPQHPDKRWRNLLEEAEATVKATQGHLHVDVLHVADPVQAAVTVQQLLASLPELGAITGGHTNAVTK